MGVTCERDIEYALIEPFLKALGYSRSTCIRKPYYQTAGKQVGLIPDYAFVPPSDRFRANPFEVRMVLEAKFRIRTDNRFKEAYRQVKLYASELKCHTALLAALEGLWIIPSGTGAFNRLAHATWDELHGKELFNQVASLIGPSAMIQ